MSNALTQHDPIMQYVTYFLSKPSILFQIDTDLGCHASSRSYKKRRLAEEAERQREKRRQEREKAKKAKELEKEAAKASK